MDLWRGGNWIWTLLSLVLCVQMVQSQTEKRFVKWEELEKAENEESPFRLRHLLKRYAFATHRKKPSMSEFNMEVPFKPKSVRREQNTLRWTIENRQFRKADQFDIQYNCSKTCKAGCKRTEPNTRRRTQGNVSLNLTLGVQDDADLRTIVMRLVGVTSKQTDQLDALMDEISKQNNTITSQEKHIHSLEDTISQQTQTITSQNKNITSLNTQINEQNKNITSLYTQINEQNKNITSLDTQIHSLEDTISQQTQTITSQNKNITSLNTQINEQNKNITSLTTHTKDQDRQIEFLKNIINKMDKRGQDNTAVVLQLRNTMAVLNQTVLEQETSMLQIMNPPGYNGTTRCAFSARYNDNDRYSTGSTLKFSDIDTNIGKAYDGASGDFTAPYDGVYVFTLVVMTWDSNNYVQVSIRKNTSQRLTGVFAQDKDYEDQTSTSCVVSLTTGDTIRPWVDGYDGFNILYSDYSTFSGFLLYPS